KVGDPDHLELPYAQAMNIGLAFAEAPKRALIIGLGGGSIPMFLHKHYPKMQIDVVDIDPEVVTVAKQFFGFYEDEFLKAHVEDGRKFIERCKKPYDMILLDAYGKDSIPRSLVTREFFQAVRRALSPRGVLVGNVWSRDSNPLYDSVVRTYQDVFAELYIFDVRSSGNKIFIALPYQLKVRSGDLARKAGEISKQKGFRFDLGDAVKYGYQYATERVISDPVLTDDRDAPKIIRPPAS
ncbi:MAG: fused MFS/spermidine synthase, partial [Planctomycetes bacterium]|nr:fused MFS/spermidine synthase [Planctomycetota bacterium]